MNLHFAPNYLVSMTGIHGAGKGTLREGLAAELGLRHADVKIFGLGRMLDVEGLWTCRDNALRQNQLALGEGEAAATQAVTSRLGLLDVAIYGLAMSNLGRLERAGVDEVIARAQQDIESGAYRLPQALIAMLCDPEILQERLIARDASKGVAASRGSKPLARVVAQLRAIYVDRQYPHPFVERLLEHYRSQDRFMFIDTSATSIAEVRAQARAFVEALPH